MPAENNMLFCQIEFGSTEYLASLKLREAMLRLPHGLALSKADTEHDAQHLHFAFLQNKELQNEQFQNKEFQNEQLKDKQLLACLVIQPLKDGHGKLRQMCVDKNQQGKQLGTHLIKQTEMALQTLGFNFIEMAARKSAVGFYEKLGYAIQGDSFTMLGIEHITMVRSLTA